MCGITCIVSPRARALGAAVRGMTRQLRHRGPDGEGYLLLGGSGSESWHGPATPPGALTAGLPWSPTQPAEGREGVGQVALGHRRLAIVDPSPLGHQPMCWQDGRYWITYNGEVYNHLELRAELEAMGHRFRSHSDTEVILAAYAQWGPECLRRFNGMWAFAIVDREARTVFVARDRFGVKPLYYRRWEGALAFASEIKAFSALDGWRPRVNAQRAWDFLAWNVTDHTDETLFDGVFQVPAGHCALLSMDGETPPADAAGRIATRAWYELRPATFEGSYEQACEGFRDLITDAVRLRLRSDVPVGSCLSGGLDSSTLVCLMRDLLPADAGGRQWTFSATSDVAAVDESGWIDEVVRATGVRSLRVAPQPQGLFEDLRLLTWQQDEPFGSSSIYAQWCVFRLAGREGVKVLLDGQGADEQLAGYHGFMGPRLKSLLAGGRLTEFVREANGLHARLGYSYGHIGQRVADQLLPGRLRQQLRGLAGRPSAMHKPWLDERFGARVQRDAAATPRAGSVQELSRALLTSGHLPMLLRWEDRNSMAFGVESRVPFLDWRLVEFNLGLPDAYKLREGFTKRVLRGAMQGILPERVRLRTDKIGFATPQEVWMRDTAAVAFRSAFAEVLPSARGVLSSAASAHFDRALAGGSSSALAEAWRLLSFSTWMSVYEATVA